MILFPILQPALFTVLGCLFLVLWCMGLVFILRGLFKVRWSINPFSANGLQEANAQIQAFREIEETPLGLRLDWTLKRFTLVGVILAISFGIERVLAATTSLERSSLLQ